MRTFDEVIQAATSSGVRLRVNTTALSRVTDGAVDGLFHVPLLALAEVVICSARREEGLPVADVGTWTLATLSHHFEALRLSRSHIRWSVLLRRRCADALIFLEESGLVVVREAPNRTAYATHSGTAFVRAAAGGPDELGVLTRQIRRAYRAAHHTGLSLL